jgi:hypothetical protein
MNESLPPVAPKKDNSRTIIAVVVGVIVLCCVCIATVLVAQYLLENSDFSLVRLAGHLI